MAPNPLMVNAFRAMRDLGISEDKVQPALMKLLIMHSKNWDLIEAENYQVLVDAIFEIDDKQRKHEDEEEAQVRDDELQRPLKRSRLRHQNAESSSQANHNSSSCLAETSPNLPKDESVKLPKVSALTLFQCREGTTELRSGKMMQKERRNEGSSSRKSTEHPRGDFSATYDNRAGSELAKVRSESSSQLEFATSPLTEVKLSLSCTSRGGSGFHMPEIDTVVKLVEDMCLQLYKITDPNFSVRKVMKDICECVLLLGSENSEDQTQTSSKTGKSEMVSSNAMNNFRNTQLEAAMALPIGLDRTPKLIENGGDSNGSHFPVEQHQLNPDQICSRDDVIDICKGHEKVVISLVNNLNDEAPPSFHYIPKNVVFQNAYVNFSLARIGDDNSCSHCVSDCLSRPIPCACSYETGGEFVYTAEGLVKEEFLEECVSMNRDPEKHCQFFCKECPLERSKQEEIIEPCKGHLVRSFIKECWWKCGCNKQCGNRVVQQGITRNLQVFMTKGKGWALRTLEDLPKGAFVCEYVGEVLTNAELFDRVSKCPEGEKHSYPVLLDADWGSEGVLNDEEALCLDATYYGNVARFINHRCFDSTLVEIPVEIETPDHHYYHLAFFTSRKVKAMEELTWDYGINFGDRKHPVKAFRCQCGSRFCRNTRRRKRFSFGRRVR